MMILQKFGWGFPTKNWQDAQFALLHSNLQRNFPKSPACPNNLEEYEEVLHEARKAQSRDARRNTIDAQKVYQSIHGPRSHNEPFNLPLKPAFGGRTFRGNRGTVLSYETIWCPGWQDVMYQPDDIERADSISVPESVSADSVQGRSRMSSVNMTISTESTTFSPRPLNSFCQSRSSGGATGATQPRSGSCIESNSNRSRNVRVLLFDRDTISELSNAYRDFHEFGISRSGSMIAPVNECKSGSSDIIINGFPGYFPNKRRKEWPTKILRGMHVAKWPSASELRWEGDDRAATKVGRFFPLPRIQRPDIDVSYWYKWDVLPQYEFDKVRYVPDEESIWYPVAEFEGDEGQEVLRILGLGIGQDDAD